MVKNLPTGAAQPVTNTVERVRLLFAGRQDWAPKAKPVRPASRAPFKREAAPVVPEAD